MDHGIPERYTRPRILDLIPDVITDEEMDAMKRHIQGEAMGLIDCVCAECGCKFIAHREHQFKRIIKTRKGTRTAFWCSHKCFRPIEAAEEEEYRRRMLGAWAGPKERTNLDYAKEEVVKCREHLEAAEAKKNSEVWESMNKDQRRRLNDRIAMWRARLVLAETELEEMEKNAAN